MLKLITALLILQSNGAFVNSTPILGSLLNTVGNLIGSIISLPILDNLFGNDGTDLKQQFQSMRPVCYDNIINADTSICVDRINFHYSRIQEYMVVNIIIMKISINKYFYRTYFIKAF